MKICYISHGCFTHIKPYLEYFSSTGHEVCFIQIAPGPDSNVKTYDVSIGKRYSTGFDKFKYILSSFKARNIIKKIKPDIVHTQYATSGGLAGLICGFHPTVVTVHGSDLTRGKNSLIWRPLLRKIFTQADRVNVVSSDLKTMAVELGIPAEKIDVLTLGIDTDKFSFTQKEIYGGKRPLRLVSTRRLEPVYDHSTIIKALAVLKDKQVNFKMTFIGCGVLEDELKKMVKDLRLEDDIIFKGGCGNAQVPKYLHENDIYLSASLWDGTSLCLLEAMATGIFPVVSRIKANLSWLEHGVGGLLFESGNAENMAECILQLYNNPTMTVNAAYHNCEKVNNDGNRKKNMARLESIYKDLICKTVG